MTELFVDGDSSKKEGQADSGLPVDKSEWPLAIEEQLIAQEPYLADFQININLKKVDEQSQIGFGSVKVSSNDKEIDIPIIIDGGKIKPFDVMIYNGEAMPLNKNRVNEIFAEYNIADKVTDEDDMRDYSDAAGDLTDEGGYLPEEGLYASNRTRGSRQKVSSMLDKIDGEVYESDLEKLSSLFDDQELAQFAVNGTGEIVKKALNANTKAPSDDSWKSIKQDNVLLCKETSPNKVKITKTARNSETADTKEVAFDKAKEIIKNAGYDDSGLDNLSPENAVSFTPYDGNTAKINESQEMLERKQSEDGSCIAKTASGEDKEGLVVSNLVDFNMGKVAENIFVSNDEYALENKFLQKESSKSHTDAINTGELEEGATGLFIKTGKDNYWATVPFDVEKRASIESYDIAYIRPFGSMEKIAVVESPDLKQITKVANPQDSALSTASDEIYFVPDDMEFIKISEEIDLAKEKSEVSDTLTKESMRVYNNSDNTYTIDAEHNYKNYDMEKLSEAEAKFVLANHGLNNQSIDSIIKKANNRDVISFSNIKQPESFEKVSNKIDAIEDELKQSAEEIKNNLNTKIAAELKDENSVDAILALSLVNQENMSQFINNIDKYKEVLTDVSEMLLLARLGSNTLPEESLADALSNLENVISRLQEIQIILN